MFERKENYEFLFGFLNIGLLDSEVGIYVFLYDVTGIRLVICEVDKTIKMWKEDETVIFEIYFFNFKLFKDIRRF